MTRVAIADDHQVLIDGLSIALESQDDLEYVGAVTHGSEVLDLVAQKKPDVLLLDIDLPERSGLDLCLDITTNHPHTSVIALTSFGAASIIKKMMRNGASGYVLKNAGSGEIISAIRSVARGERFLSDIANQVLLDDLAGQPSAGTTFTPILTRREKEVLKLVSQGLTTTEIGKALFISENTVESHRKNLMHKFDAKNAVDLVRMAFERGIIDN